MHSVNKVMWLQHWNGERGWICKNWRLKISHLEWNTFFGGSVLTDFVHDCSSKCTVWKKRKIQFWILLKLFLQKAYNLGNNTWKKVFQDISRCENCKYFCFFYNLSMFVSQFEHSLIFWLKILWSWLWLFSWNEYNKLYEILGLTLYGKF